MRGLLKHIPNALTALRLLLLLPFLQALAADDTARALVILALAALTDMLDGFLARYFDWRTWWGSIFDPLADKVLVFVCYPALAWHGIVPVWLCVMVLVRDTIMLGGSWAYWRLVGRFEGNPTLLGKLTTFLAMGVAVLALFEHACDIVPATLTSLLQAGLVLTALVSTLQYVRFGLAALQAGQEDRP